MLGKRLKNVTSETVGAKADVAVELICACGVVHARRRGALVYIHVAVTASPSGLANATIISH